MSEPFIGEIRMFAGNFAPRDWAFCDGQLLAIAENDALFSLLGTTYGGDGQTTFGLPDLRGRIPIHMGSGPGLSPRTLGGKGGAESVTLTVNQLPAHTHPIQASTAAATSNNPSGQVTAESPSVAVYAEIDANLDMSGDAVTSAGGNGSHENVMPFLCVSFIICLSGIYPSRQ